MTFPANHNLPFSIIIVNYNTKQLLLDCLQSLFTNCPNDLFEVIVVDNHSSDGSVLAVQERYGQRLQLIVSQDNIGFGPANNLGAKAARGQFLFLLNSDTLVESDILSPLIKLLDSYPQLGIIAPRLLLANGQDQPYAFGNFKGLIAKIKKRELPVVPGSCVVDWVSGAALIIKQDLFAKLGGFDPNFFMYYEDIDLCYRAKQAGYQVAVSSDIKLIHLGGRSSSLRQKKKYYYRSQTYFYRKHGGWLVAWILVMIRWPKQLYYLWHK